ncbi:hypothetical protein HNR23_001998 [Nocardiopsis mwathae]|uniref:Integration host factor-like helix-two turn-helix domain-containing protein n=1 Tax=Nocardiopsis mwathae TaxID=1472723 RepID=A0A7W9YGX2_9ACTN|nr:integration host factor, actinobacterial type [Nocardiopsis mwathae]MBB6171938.1 hypothetical protein [Nocardiopsis mwathae]
MPLLSMTPVQRMAAQENAATARRSRTALLDSVRSGRSRLSNVFARAERDPVVARTKVSLVLHAVPGIGTARVVALMAEVGIGADRRIGELGDRQRRELVARVG